MRTNKINNLVYETIVFITGLPYDLESGKDSDQIKDAILKRFETIPKRYRQDVFRAMDQKASRYDYGNYGIWHCYIRQIRNAGQGPLFQ